MPALLLVEWLLLPALMAVLARAQNGRFPPWEEVGAYALVCLLPAGFCLLVARYYRRRLRPVRLEGGGLAFAGRAHAAAVLHLPWDRVEAAEAFDRRDADARIFLGTAGLRLHTADEVLFIYGRIRGYERLRQEVSDAMGVRGRPVVRAPPRVTPSAA